MRLLQKLKNFAHAYAQMSIKVYMKNSLGVHINYLNHIGYIVYNICYLLNKVCLLYQIWEH